MYFITIHGEHNDRLGAHLMFYMNQIFYAYYHRYAIKYDLETLPYRSSIFLQILLKFVDRYNDSLPRSEEKEEVDVEVFPFPKGETIDWAKTMFRTLKLTQTDFRSFCREIYPEMYTDLLKYSSYVDIPFDPKKTIAVHLRLDDVHNWRDYNGTASANYYRDLVKKQVSIDEMYHIHNYQYYPNIQAPIAMERIESEIQDAKLRFPDHEVVIISSPKTQHLIQSKYRVICNEDESLDLFLLTIADVVILSRSTFSIASMVFGNHARIYAPLWGQLVYYGFYSKYDHNPFLITYYH